MLEGKAVNFGVSELLLANTLMGIVSTTYGLLSYAIEIRIKVQTDIKYWATYYGLLLGHKYNLRAISGQKLLRIDFEIWVGPKRIQPDPVYQRLKNPIPKKKGVQ